MGGEGFHVLGLLLGVGKGISRLVSRLLGGFYGVCLWGKGTFVLFYLGTAFWEYLCGGFCDVEDILNRKVNV